MNFRFLNIPVQISPSFWLFFIFFTDIFRNFSIEGLILGGVLIFSLLVHEYGHALTALYFGARPEITLEAFGGNAQYNSFGITPKKQFLITLNGPLLESLLIVLSYSLLKLDIFGNYYIRYILYATMRLNILWCLLNLIPVAPLDGGHLVGYLLESKFGEKGFRASLIFGIISVILVAPYLFYREFFFFGILLVIFGFQNFKLLQSFISPTASDQLHSLNKAIEALNNDDPQEAKAMLKKLLKSKDEQVKKTATEYLAKIYHLENETQKAYELLLNTDPQILHEGKCLLCKLAFDLENYELVTKYARDIYEIDPSYEIALLNSKAFAYTNQPAHSGAWLETASQFENAPKASLKDLLQKKIYDSVRDQEAFKQYAEKI